MPLADDIKDLLPEPKHRIRLHDLVAAQVKTAVTALQSPLPDAGVVQAEVARRIDLYEAAVADLQVALALLARWSDPAQLRLVERILTRVAEADKPTNGTTGWIGLAWHPTILLIYTAGISALSESRYDVLSTALTAPVFGRYHTRAPRAVAEISIDEFTHSAGNEVLQLLPGLERNRAPRSVYLFRKLRPLIEEHVDVGRSYERLFDRFEVFLALFYSDLNQRRGGTWWGPPGRFYFNNDGMYEAVLKEAEEQEDNWPPLRAGMFKRSAKRFAEVAQGFSARISGGG